MDSWCWAGAIGSVGWVAGWAGSLVGSLVLFAFYYDCSLTPSSFCILSLHSSGGLKGESKL